MSQCVATANSRDSCSHNTSMSGLGGVGVRGGEGGGVRRKGEKLAYGQSQCVTFGLEFTLGSDAHTNELERIVGLRRRRGV